MKKIERRIPLEKLNCFVPLNSEAGLEDYVRPILDDMFMQSGIGTGCVPVPKAILAGVLNIQNTKGVGFFLVYDREDGPSKTVAVQLVSDEYEIFEGEFVYKDGLDFEGKHVCGPITCFELQDILRSAAIGGTPLVGVKPVVSLIG